MFMKKLMIEVWYKTMIDQFGTPWLPQEGLTTDQPCHSQS